MAKGIRNLGASVRARLLSVSQANGQAFDLVLVRFAMERLLYRISQSAHADHFVLKGAMVLMTWLDAPHRATRDLDLLGFGDPNPDDMLVTFKDILSLNFDDAVTFDVNGLRVNRIRDALEYGGLRLRTTAAIDGPPCQHCRRHWVWRHARSRCRNSRLPCSAQSASATTAHVCT